MNNSLGLNNIVFLLLKGRVNFLHRRKTNMKSIVEDSYFGEIEVFKNCARLFSVRAQVDTQLLVLRRDQFLDVLENFPEIKKIFLARSLLKAFNIKMCFIKVNQDCVT
jgi:CRP-like cAMP-binding protein